jgi:protein SCO1/2
MKRLLIALAAIAALTACQPAAAPAKDGAPAGCILGQLDQFGGPLGLLDEAGQPITEAVFKGKPTLIYFGFTFCPDICPMSMQTAAAAFAALPAGAPAPQAVLISLDPGRDTPEMMKSYVASAGFPPGLRGLTGAQEQVAAAAKAFRVSWRRNEQPESAAGYLIDHSSFFYLMDADWKTRAVIASTQKPDEIAACIAKALK